MNRFDDVTQQVYGNSNGYGKKSSNSMAIDKLSNKDKDIVLDYYSQLIDEEYRGWFSNKLDEIGKRKFTDLADRAIKYGRDPKKMFSHLLKS